MDRPRRTSKAAMLVATLLLTTSCAHGQHEFGIAAGWFNVNVRTSTKDNHASVRVDPASWSASNATLFFNWGRGARTRRGLSLDYSRMAFQISRGSHYYYEKSDYDLHMLHLGIVPRTRIDDRGWFFLRYGIQLGCTIHGTRTGRIDEYALGYVPELYDHEPLFLLLNDSRLVFGVSFVVPLSDRIAISLDPLVSFGITTIIGGDPHVRHKDLGASAAFYWLFPAKTEAVPTEQ